MGLISEAMMKDYENLLSLQEPVEEYLETLAKLAELRKGAKV